MVEELKPFDNAREQIDTTLALADGERINVCYALYRIIEGAPPDPLCQNT